MYQCIISKYRSRAVSASPFRDNLLVHMHRKLDSRLTRFWKVLPGYALQQSEALTGT